MNSTQFIERKRIMKTLAAGFFLALLLSGVEVRAQQCKRITFQRGLTSAVLKGKVSIDQPVCYKLRARNNQRLVAHLTSPRRRVRFSVSPDYFDADFLEGAADVTDWDGKLFSNAGDDFMIVVTLTPRNAEDSFTLEVTIPPAGRTTSSRRAPVAPCGDFSGEYLTHYGPLQLTRTGDQVRGVYTTDDGKDSTVTGTVRGNILTGRWAEPGRKGTLRFTLDPDGRSFTGSFAFDGDPNEAGEWGGHCRGDGDQ